ncbi:MAG: amidohydrolase [Croceicoccus sp.]|nr:amidohydrolase [Croceicoccus sp.]MAL24399.1 amidohydrolase [Croceicoccus sp.]|tara:strand:+ start:62740 stop:65979 length:3240 start_codon:yes stop_codon:yes gene_type:complete
MDARRLAGVIASLLMVWPATSFANGSASTEADGAADVLPPTPSGLPPIARAEPGATLPLAPEREIVFTVEEGTALQPALSPDGRTIVFAMLGDIYSLPSTGGGARAMTRGMAMDTQPVFSPDGNWIAFLSDRSGPENIWIMRSDGSEARQISFHGGDPVFTSPAWSADGRSIYVSRFWSDRNAYELWRIPLDGNGIGDVIISTGQEGGTHHALGAVPTADDTALIYAAREGDLDLASPVEWRITRRDLASGREEVLVKAVGDIRLGKVQSSAFRPALSHDGNTLAYVQRRTGETWLRLHDLTTGRERDLVQLDPDALQASFWSDIAPRVAFTPDDAAIIFSKDGKLQRVTLESGSVETIPFRAEVKAGLGPLTRQPVRVETGPLRARIIQHPALSPDGSTLAFSALGAVYTMPASGGDAAPVAVGLPPQFHPSWTRDGKALLFVTWTAAEGGHVWRVDLASGTPTRQTEKDAFYTHPVEAPDGSVLAIQSPTADRLAGYVEFGQFRQAQLVRLRLGGAGNEVLAEGDMGGAPHFLADGTLLLNRPDGVYRVDTGEKMIGVTGPNWYFAQGPAQADDIRVSPDGRQALAQIAQQLHLVNVPTGEDRIVALSDTGSHRQLSDVGADFFGWSAAGTPYWSVGSTVFSRTLGSPDTASVTAEVVLPRDVPQGQLLLTGATAITQGSQGTIENADLLIENDRIAQVGPAGTIDVPQGTTRRDMTGRFVMPGFIDVHDHVADIRRDVLDFEPWGPAANLAYGVTTAFDPSTLTVDMLAYQDALDAGLVLGSRIFSTGTAIFSFNDFRSREDVRNVLRRYSDFYRLSNIKMYRSGNRIVRQWIAEEAADLGLQPTAEGALAMKLDLTHILDGYSGNEHAIPPPVLYDDVTQLLARSGTSYDLTLQITHGGYPAQDFFIARDAPHGDPKYARFAPSWFRDQKFWQREWTDPEGYVFTRTAASAAEVFRSGGLVAIGAHGEVPGLGTHWEMQAHQMGGWTPEEILTAATINGAKAIGREADLGSIETGKLADLVILSRDPRIDIANTLAIEHVMKGGRLYDADTLAQIWPDKVPAPAFWFSPVRPAAD